MKKIVSETKQTRLENWTENKMNFWKLTIIPTGQTKIVCGNAALVELMIAEDKIAEAWK